MFSYDVSWSKYFLPAIWGGLTYTLIILQLCLTLSMTLREYILTLLAIFKNHLWIKNLYFILSYDVFIY